MWPDLGSNSPLQIDIDYEELSAHLRVRVYRVKNSWGVKEHELVDVPCINSIHLVKVIYIKLYRYCAFIETRIDIYGRHR